MPSINHYPTFHYSQPDEYHFSHDSVFLARQIFEDLNSLDLSKARALDICSGSGIVGLDFLFHRRKENQSLPLHFDFLEIQESYREHFLENQKRFGPISTEMHFLNRNYDDLMNEDFQNRYDLIVCNPPYFFVGQGKLSPSEFKNRCRFFMDSTLKNLLWGMASSLKLNSSSYLLLRDLPEYRWNVMEEIEKICADRMKISLLGDIRGQHFLKLTKTI